MFNPIPLHPELISSKKHYKQRTIKPIMNVYKNDIRYIKNILLKLFLQDSEVVRSARHLLSLLTSGSAAGPSQDNARFFCGFLFIIVVTKDS